MNGRDFHCTEFANSVHRSSHSWDCLPVTLGAVSATRLPNNRCRKIAATRGLVGRGVSRGNSERPRMTPVQLTSSGPLLLAGHQPSDYPDLVRLLDRVQKYWTVENLSPLSDAALVHPPATYLSSLAKTTAGRGIREFLKLPGWTAHVGGTSVITASALAIASMDARQIPILVNAI